MYNLIQNLISHTWQTGSYTPGDQQYIYYICSALIVVFFVVLVDSFMSFFRSITRLNRK